MFDRRNLLKGALGVAGSFFLPKNLFAKRIDTSTIPRHDLFNIQGKTDWIAHQADMVLDWHSVLRKVLMVDSIPYGAIPIYDRSNHASVIWDDNHQSKGLNKPFSNIYYDSKFTKQNQKLSKDFKNSILIPTYHIPSTLSREKNDSHRQEFKDEKELSNRHEFYKHKLIQVYACKEEYILMNLLESAVKLNKMRRQNSTIRAKNRNKKNLVASLDRGFAMIERWDLVVRNVIMHPEMARSLVEDYKLGKNFMDVNTIKEKNDILFGHLWTADILTTIRCPKNVIYFTSERDCVGPMPIRQKLTIIPRIENGKIVLVDFEEIGAGILTSDSVAKLELI